MVVDMGYCIKVIRKVALLAVSLLLIWLGFRLAIFYIPFLIGFIISLMIEPIIKTVVVRTKVSRKTGATIVLLVIFSILIGLISWGMIRAVTEASNLLQTLNIHIERIYYQVQGYINNLNFDRFNIPQQVVVMLETGANDLLGTVASWITSFLTSILQGITSLPILVIYIVITILSTYFICTDKLYILDQVEHHFPKQWVKKTSMHLKEITTAVGNYLKAEMTLVLITFTIVLIGLYILQLIGLNINYPLLAALRNRINRCTSYLGCRNNNDSLGNYCCSNWRY